MTEAFSSEEYLRHQKKVQEQFERDKAQQNLGQELLLRSQAKERGPGLVAVKETRKFTKVGKRWINLSQVVAVNTEEDPYGNIQLWIGSYSFPIPKEDVPALFKALGIEEGGG